MKLQFLGANRQVTGSRYLLEAAGARLLIDCGMFQERQFVHRNYDRPPFEASQIDALLLTHAHLDHCGLAPRLVRNGFNGPIYSTAPTADLASLIMLDSARIQEEDVAAKKRRHKRENRKSKHPYEPLYTPDDAARTETLFHPVTYGTPQAVTDHVTVTYHEAGHILGAASLEVVVHEGKNEARIVFSGDVGLWDKPLIRDPRLLSDADYVVMESTYGTRDHIRTRDIEDQLDPIINDTVKRGGNVLIPTFAVERAQELMYHLSILVRQDRIPDLLVFLDSPMAVNATKIFRKHRNCFDEKTMAMLEDDHSPLDFQGLVLSRTVGQSKAINAVRGTCVIMAGSGMCTGGRIKHHLVRNIWREESTVVFVGYQSHGTLGRHIVDGAKKVRIFGKPRLVGARIERIDGMSAHADKSTLQRWIGHFDPKPKRVFLTHGEEDVALSLADTLRTGLNVDVEVPKYQQVVELA
jgi:metallo-beta-lactamase family protein